MVICEAIKDCELVRQGIFFESKAFHIRNVVSSDLFRVHGFRNVSGTTCSVWPQTKGLCRQPPGSNAYRPL